LDGAAGDQQAVEREGRLRAAREGEGAGEDRESARRPGSERMATEAVRGNGDGGGRA
jgi:hypothetical protein